MRYLRSLAEPLKYQRACFGDGVGRACRSDLIPHQTVRQVPLRQVSRDRGGVTTQRAQPYYKHEGNAKDSDFLRRSVFTLPTLSIALSPFFERKNACKTQENLVSAQGARDSESHSVLVYLGTEKYLPPPPREQEKKIFRGKLWLHPRLR